MRGGAVAARRAHNPKVTGSSPVPATKKRDRAGLFFDSSLRAMFFGEAIFNMAGRLLRRKEQVSSSQ
jgi:hypothetical protein